jgi:hypothetical protein
VVVVSDLRRQRREIVEKTGRREATFSSGLQKTTLNSVVAWLSGEYAVKPEDEYAPDSSDKSEIKEEVAKLCGLTDYLGHRRDQYNHGVADRPFNTSELSKILAEMESSGDNRPLSAGETGDLTDM